jgi:hypothetical protein
MRCRKGIFELENIVNMATFPTLYKKDFAELPFVNVVFDRMVMIYMEFVIFSLFAMHLDYCNIQRVCDQLGRNSHCLHIHKTTLTNGNSAKSFLYIFLLML